VAAWADVSSAPNGAFLWAGMADRDAELIPLTVNEVRRLHAILSRPGRPHDRPAPVAATTSEGASETTNNGRPLIRGEAGRMSQGRRD
jgi:hypothetical protein